MPHPSFLPHSTLQDDPRWALADPICTFLFAALVLWTTKRVLRDIADVLMERVPRGLNIADIEDDITAVSARGCGVFDQGAVRRE